MMGNIEAIIMLAVSWALGMTIFCAGSIGMIACSKKVRKWLVEAAMKWSNEIVRSMIDTDNQESEP